MKLLTLKLENFQGLKSEEFKFGGHDHRRIIRDEAAIFLGRRPTDEEMKWALPRAQKKLAWIIEREGDADGIRQQPWYLGKLVEEAIVEEKFSQHTIARCMEIEAQRQATAAGHVE